MDAAKPWAPRAGEWSFAAAAHLLRRGGLGGRRDELEEALAGSPGEALEKLQGVADGDRALRASAEHLLAGGQEELLAGWWMSLLLSGTAPLRERVTLMWHGHFATSNAKVNDVRLMHRQNELLRELGLGDFRVLLHAVAQDPAMLVFLDGNENRRGEPNENLARELMELFALGRGNYTETDVQEAARALTGWGTAGRAFRVRAEHHDAGEKSLFGARGPWRGEDLIERVLAHPACPLWVARRLLVEFVAPHPEPAWIEAWARRLVTLDWNIERTLAELLGSELFFSPAARRARIAAPVELVVGTARLFGAKLAPVEAARLAREMGQALFRPPSVKGWDGSRAWINAGAWVARNNYLASIADPEQGLSVDLSEALGDPRTPAEAAQRAVGLCLPDLAGGDFAAAIATAARNAGEAGAAARLACALILTSPEYQLS